MAGEELFKQSKVLRMVGESACGTGVAPLPDAEYFIKKYGKKIMGLQRRNFDKHVSRLLQPYSVSGIEMLLYPNAVSNFDGKSMRPAFCFGGAKGGLYGRKVENSEK